MNGEDSISNDPLQLQQMIIFLEEEIDRYKKQDSDHSSLIDLLERDNVQLMQDKKELSKELFALKSQFATSQISEREQEESSLRNMLEDYKLAIEKLEKKLVGFIHEENKQVQIKKEELEKINQNNNESRKVEERLVMDLEEKDMTIRKLRQDLLDLKRKSDVQRESSQKVGPISLLNTETLEQLENQIKRMFTDSLAYEQKLNEKLFILNNFERKIDQLTSEITE